MLQKHFHEVVQSDVLIIGAGFAGSRACIALRDQGVEVVLVDKGMLSRSGCSSFAAGVITVWFPEDDLEAWIEETVSHGQYMNDQDWVRILYVEGFDRIREIEKWGVEFERDKNGNILKILGRGQLPDKSLRNMMFHGIQFMNTMRKEVLHRDARVLSHVTVTDLIKIKGRVCGAVGFHPRTGRWYLFKAKAVIIAAGGNCFKTLTIGHKNITGDAHGMAFRAGASHTCFEFGTQQSCARNHDITGINMFVGQGAKFVNRKGEAFLAQYYPEYQDREIIPNIAGAMAAEVKKGNGPIYIDMTHFDDEKMARMKRVIPHAMRVFDRAGIDIQREKLEWVARGGAYTTASGGGGLVIDHHCRSTVEGLWAIGDSACTTVYNGVGDSGGQNLLWCLVSGVRAAHSVAAYVKEASIPLMQEEGLSELRRQALLGYGKDKGIAPSDLVLKLQETIFPWDITIIRHEARLKKALGKVEAMVHDDLPNVRAADYHEVNKANEIKNMLLCAELVLRSAIYRTETRGGNFREDHPYTDNENWLKWVIAEPSDSGKMELTSTPIPIESYPFRPREKKIKHPIFVHTD